MSLPIRLRPVVAADLPTLFEFQSDPESCRLAAVNPRDRAAFEATWAAILADRSGAIARAILEGDTLVGSIGCFKLDGHDAVGYWIARQHPGGWGRGIATRALGLLLEEVKVRPLHARAAAHNAASIRVLERNGFVVTEYRDSPGTDRYHACVEAVMVLAGGPITVAGGPITVPRSSPSRG
ncbi:MAG: GNAT family N-acetyltransferase [Phycisphaerales bacterium]